MPTKLDSSEAEESLVPARMLNELAYCPRLMHLEWVQAEWAESSDTVAGTREHAASDRPKGRMPQAQQLAEAEDENDVLISARAVWMSAPLAGLTAKMDLVEGKHGVVRPVET